MVFEGRFFNFYNPVKCTAMVSVRCLYGYCDKQDRLLDVFNQLKTFGVRVIFEGNGLETANTDIDLMVAVMESIAQAENESGNENIKWGIKQRAAAGTSKLYDRKCYGYKHDEDGHLVIDEVKAKKC